ncbi:MAG: TIGR02996 domain-containing protein, partial [Myxococcota bacterium]
MKWSMSELHRRLATIRGDVETGHLSMALQGLVAVWGETRDPQVANAIFALDAILAPHRPRLPRTGSGVISPTGWLRRASDPHPADISVLAGTFFLHGGGRPAVRKRLQTLQQMPPDPRIFQALVEFLPRRSDRDPTFNPALMRHADPFCPDVKSTTRIPTGAHRELQRWNTDHVPVPADAWQPIADLELPRPGTKKRKIWFELRQPVPNRELDELWRAVMDAPDEDGPRHVFADCLAQTDPELGRFIQLQLKASHQALTGAEQRAVRAVVRDRL